MQRYLEIDTAASRVEHAGQLSAARHDKKGMYTHRQADGQIERAGRHTDRG